jgi:hypothetical protein
MVLVGLVDPEDPDRPRFFRMLEGHHLAVLVHPEADVVGNFLANDQALIFRVRILERNFLLYSTQQLKRPIIGLTFRVCGKGLFFVHTYNNASGVCSFVSTSMFQSYMQSTYLHAYGHV